MESLTVAELKKRCKKRKLVGYSRLRKAELIAMLRGPAKRAPKRPAPRPARRPARRPPPRKCRKRSPAPLGRAKCRKEGCDSGKVCNPHSGRCVQQKGPTHKKLCLPHPTDAELSKAVERLVRKIWREDREVTPRAFMKELGRSYDVRRGQLNVINRAINQTYYKHGAAPPWAEPS